MRHNKNWYISKNSPYTHELFSQNHRVTEVGGDLWRSTGPAFPAEAGPPTAVFSGPCPDVFSVSPGMGTQSLWATSATAQLPSQYKKF